MRDGATKTVFSHGVGLLVGLLMIAPLINYTVPLIVNSYYWLYLVCASGLLGMMLLTTSLNWSLKFLSVYLFVSCFISQIPYLAFNAYILVVAALYLFLLSNNLNRGPILRFVEAVFWLQVILATFQFFGMDQLVNFKGVDFEIAKNGAIAIDGGTGEVVPPVMVGTVMQYMRFGTLLVVAAPFLIWRNRWYIFPLLIVCVMLKSSTLAVALLAGAATYAALAAPRNCLGYVFIIIISLLCLYALYDYGSFKGAIWPAHGGRLSSWWAALCTWVMDTSSSQVPPFKGPWNWSWFFFGHGMDTFLPLFPIYKHDLNPFPQAHNDWIQIAWETGIVGLGLFTAYCSSLVRRLLRYRRFGLVAGCSMMATVMFFAFPMRMTQTMFLLVVWVGLCEGTIIYEKKARFG